MVLDNLHFFQVREQGFTAQYILSDSGLRHPDPLSVSKPCTCQPPVPQWATFVNGQTVLKSALLPAVLGHMSSTGSIEIFLSFLLTGYP